MKEFQALGLDVSIINDEGKTLQLKDIEDSEDKEDFSTSIDEVENSPAREIKDEPEDSDDEEYDESDEYDDDFDDSEEFDDSEDFDDDELFESKESEEEGADI